MTKNMHKKRIKVQKWKKSLLILGLKTSVSELDFVHLCVPVPKTYMQLKPGKSSLLRN